MAEGAARFDIIPAHAGIQHYSLAAKDAKETRFFSSCGLVASERICICVYRRLKSAVDSGLRPERLFQQSDLAQIFLHARMNEIHLGRGGERVRQR